jgi:phosphoribosylanthranilate isomerase
MSLKVCGMRDPDNIRDLVEVVQPDWMGLIFYPPSPRFVENALAESIRNFRVNKVGVFVNASMEEIGEKVGLFGLDAIQLHGDESPEFAKMLKEKPASRFGRCFW